MSEIVEVSAARSWTRAATRPSRSRSSSSPAPRGRAAVPSGASTGAHEAVELRDGGDRFGGKGVRSAVGERQRRDRRHGGRPRRRRPAPRSTTRSSSSTAPTTRRASAPTRSSACRSPSAKAVADECGLPLYRYVGGANAHVLPLPLLNVLNGGAHADSNVDVQEFMLAPVGAASFAEALRWGAETYHALRGLLHDRGLSTGLGDEGGFAPDLPSNEEALKLLVAAIDARRATRRATDDRARASTSRATELFDDGRYQLAGEGRIFTSARVRRLPRATSARGTRSCRSRTGWPRTTGTAGPRSPASSATRSSSSATTSSSPTPSGSRADRPRRRELDPDQGEPDRHAHRDARHDALGVARTGTRA